MPFVAFNADNEPVVSFDLDIPEWDELRRTNRERPLSLSCGSPVTLSRRGQTRFFAHKADAMPCGVAHPPESIEHLEIKKLIYDNILYMGWEAHIEFPAPDRSWVADVLAISPDGKRRVALEVQWSRQPDHRYRERQQRYARDGVECHWFARHAGAADSETFPVSILRQQKGRWIGVDGDAAQGEEVWFIDDMLAEVLGRPAWSPMAGQSAA